MKKITPFSKKQLKRIEVIFKIFFQGSTTRKLTRNYYRDHLFENIKFQNSLIKIGIKHNSNEHVYKRALYWNAINFRRNKKLIKSLLKNFLTPFFVLGLVLVPFTVNYFLFGIQLTFWQHILNYVLTFITILSIVSFTDAFFDFIENFEVKIGRPMTKLIQLTAILLFCLLFYWVMPWEDSLIKAVLISTFFCIYFMIFALIVEFLISEVLVDMYYFSKKIQITDALILESSFQISNLNWCEIIQKRNSRQEVLLEIERLAKLIERDWSGHISPGDEKTKNWKTTTLIGISGGIRKYKREIIIPGENSAENLKEQFEKIYKNIVLHNLKGLLNEEVPAARIRKKSNLETLQSVLVSVLPLAFAICLKIYGTKLIPDAYIHIAIVISSLWIMIYVLLWLDPNLDDKITTLKSFKSVIGKNESK